MRSKERLEAIVDELWYAAEGFAGEDERPLLGKLGNSIPRLWNAIDEGNPYRVALAALAVGRRFDDIFQPLEQEQSEDLATRLQRELEGTAKARKAKDAKKQDRQRKIRDAVTQRLLAHPLDSIAYAAQCVAKEHQDAQGHPFPGWSNTSFKRAIKGMKHPNRKNKAKRK